MSLSGTLATKKVRDLFEGFDAAMLVNRTTQNEFHSRPMAIADIDLNGTT